MSHLQTRIQENDRLRLGLFIGAGIAIILLLLAGALLIRAALSPARRAGDIAPAGPDEFLILVAPFQHDGGDVYYFGMELANDLRQTPHVLGAYRVENLDAAPAEKDIPELMQKLGARVLVTGRYDERTVEAWVYFVPPEDAPPLPPDSPGPPTYFFGLAPVRYHLYAPRGIGHPLQYLQYWIIGQSHFWRGEFSEALGSFELAQQMLPGQIPVERRADMDRFVSAWLWSMGYVTGPVQGDWRVAVDVFHRSLARDPASLPSILGLAQALVQTNRPDQALDLLQAALRSQPDAWQIYFAIAEIKGQQGAVEEALALYDKAISLLSADGSPQSQRALADVYFYRGYFYYEQGDYANALSDYQQARALGREDVYLLSNLGWTAYLLGDYETAAEASSKAADLAPDRPDLLFNKGLHLLAAGRYDEAKAAYEQAIQLTLTIDDTLTRSQYFGAAYYDLDDLAQRRPDLEPIIRDIQNEIDIANG